MGILDIDIVKGFMRMCNDGWLQGWHERNGGNLTYRMKEEEVAQCRPFFDPQPREWVNMGVQADNLAGSISSPPVPASSSATWSRPCSQHRYCGRSTTRATAGASSGAWRAARSPPVSSPATL
ncbi:MAG: hypothetical protein ACLVJH_02360 [Faecalibacterium prausnitzii]